MGQCCSGQKAPEIGRADRPPQKLFAEEKTVLRVVTKHLHNLVPALLRYVEEEKAPHFAGERDELMQTVVNTLRQALVSYSKVATGGKGRFQTPLTNWEAMLVLKDYVEKTKGLQTEFGKEFRAYFLQYVGDGTTPVPPRGNYWKEAQELLRFFMVADADAGGDLTITEIMEIIEQQNIGIDPKTLKHRIKEVDASGDGKLNFEEFIKFYQNLTFKRYIERIIFTEYAKSPPSQVLKCEEFHRFLTKCQGYTGSLEDTVAMMQQLKKRGMAAEFVVPDMGKVLGMSSRHFAMYMTSTPLTDEEDRQFTADKIEHNSVFNPEKTGKVYQDMDQPMTHYFIASSHNTYLEKGQLSGPSSALAYKNALMLGCRCVELDCWDGDDGEPVVYHGHTLTTKVKFEECIKTISEFAFVKSPYPVILSLEVHTSADQQSRMGQIMKKYFYRQSPDGRGTSILQAPIAFTNHKATDHDFTPNGLKGRILVKGKMLKKDDPMFAVHIKLVKELNAQNERTGKLVSVDESKGADDEDEEEAEKNEQISTKKSSGKQNLSPELSSCVWMKSVHYRGYEETMKKGNHWDVSSFAEGALDKFYCNPKSRQEFAEVNKKVFSRIYPGGTRVDSGNYNPQPAWNMGAQIVALNYQIGHNQCPNLRYNLGKFRENGRSGYILKPSALREPGRKISDVNDNVTLTVEVIQGFRLPKPNNESKGEKIDPYVQVFINGVEEDQPGHTSDPESGRSFRTRTVEDNGWNPEWFSATTQSENFDKTNLSDTGVNCRGANTFSFKIRCLEMAVLCLRVYDEDTLNPDDFICEAVIPVSCIRQGYRAVPLKGEQYETLDSALFCRFDVARSKSV